ncbi:hypothetical protein [Nocardia tengchongensis]|uniref:hypothetical protein n=1 Tax=Nocardia tengchongensis TaxID=2055889 RepID=UPI0036087EB9
MSAGAVDLPAALGAAFEIARGRRDVRRLTAALDAAKPGEQSVASFRSPMFGPHVFTGAMTQSEATDVLTIAGQPLETSGARRGPVPELLTLTTFEPLRDEPATTTRPPYLDDLQRAVDELTHGDLVEACFEQDPYGRFSVTGFAVRAPASNVFVVGGGWFITEPHQSVPAARLVDLTLLSSVRPDHFRIPEPIHRWPEPE